MDAFGCGSVAHQVFSELDESRDGVVCYIELLKSAGGYYQTRVTYRLLPRSC